MRVPDQALRDPMTDKGVNLPAVLFGTMRRMHNVQRYSSVPVIKGENVAEHSWQIAMIAYMIGWDLRDEGWEINMELLLARAIVHDVSEALSGDIIRSYKHSSPEIKAACETADEINMARLAREIGGKSANAMRNSWSGAKDDTIEGEILKLADLLCVVSFCVNEWQLGNRAVSFVLREAYTGALAVYHGHPSLARYVDALFPTRHWQDPYQLVEE